MSVRTTAQRKQDTLAMLDQEVDLWVVSASATGDTHIIPLSFSWDGALLTVATPANSRTVRNLLRAGWARLALGQTRDVVIVEGPVVPVASGDSDEFAATHAERVGFDARLQDVEYVFLRLTPQRIQAWRNPAELSGRDIMRDGIWLA